MSPVAAAHVFDGLSVQTRVPLNVTRSEAMLSCDGFAVTTLLGGLLGHLAEAGSRDGFSLSAEQDGAETRLILSWQGEAVTDGQLTGWLKAPLSTAYGDYSGRDALSAHQTDVWAETGAGGHRIVLPLATAAPPLEPGDARPEFYDFNHGNHRPLAAGWR